MDGMSEGGTEGGKELGREGRGKKGVKGAGSGTERRRRITDLDVPVFVEVVDTSDAAAVLVRIVHVPHVARPLARIARHHRLATHTARRYTLQHFLNKIICAYFFIIT